MKDKILIIIFFTGLVLAIPSFITELETTKGINTPLPPQNVTTTLPIHSQATLEDTIIQYSIHNDINYETSLRIAMCESKMGKYKHNLQGSSAKGIFQFIDSTWKNYCEGDVLNNEDNIKCFTKLYKSHPGWWECK